MKILAILIAFTFVMSHVQGQNCTNPAACNYNPQAVTDDGSCIVPSANCTACNTANSGLILLDADGDGVCNATDPLPYDTTYSVGSVSTPCTQEAVYVAISAADSLRFVTGFDMVLQYDSSLVFPTGAVRLSPTIANAGWADYAIETNIRARQVTISIYLKAGAPSDTWFAGIGRVAEVEFARKTAFAPGNVAGISAISIVESRDSGIRHRIARGGIWTVYREDALAGKLVFWNGLAPISNDTTSPGAYLPVRIYGNNNAGTAKSTHYTSPDWFGNFSIIYPSGNCIEVVRDIDAATSVMPVINGVDAAIVLRVLLNDGHFLPSVYQLIAMDVNLDGCITAGDLSQINQRTLRIIPEFRQAWNYTDGGQTNGQASLDWVFVDKNMVSQNPAWQPSVTYPADDNTGYSRWRVPGAPRYLTVTSSPCDNVPLQQFIGIMLGDADGNYKGIAPDGRLKIAE